MTGNEIPRDEAGRVRRPKPSQLLADVMEALGPDHLTTRTLMAALIERDRGPMVEPRAVTPVYGWHVPVLADPPNVPYDMQESSLDIEATTSALSTANTANTAAINALQQTMSKLGVSGKRLIVGSATAAVSPTGGATIGFGYTFAAVPFVVAVMGDESGTFGYIQMAQSAITTSGFAVRVLARSGAPASSGTVRINYVALGTAV